MNTHGHLESNMYKFTWVIKEFSKLGKNVKDVILSPTFEVNGLKWRIACYPYGFKEPAGCFVSLYLQLLTERDLYVSSILTLSNNNGTVIKSRRVLVDHYNSRGAAWGCEDFIRRDLLLQKVATLLDDTLNITCNIHMDVYNGKEVWTQEKMCENYETLFFNENFSDLTIVIKRSKLKVHKNILSARSRVFAAMLRSDMKESNTSTIKITDVSYNVMKEFLQFIYCGKVSNLQKNAQDLLPVAEKYAVEELKALCEKSIWQDVKIESACESLKIANLYNCSDLKTKIIEYIIENIKDINKTPMFKTLLRSNPELFEEVFAKVVEEKC